MNTIAMTMLIAIATRMRSPKSLTAECGRIRVSDVSEITVVADYLALERLGAYFGFTRRSASGLGVKYRFKGSMPK